MVQDKLKLFNYLQSQQLMTLATCDGEMWACSVYFIVDEELNLYFTSSPKSLHCIQISKDCNVACNIVDSHQKFSENKIGVQVRGMAKEITGFDKIKWVARIWNKYIGANKSILSAAEMYKQKGGSGVYRVKPTLIKFFNKSLYAEGSKTFTF